MPGRPDDRCRYNPGIISLTSLTMRATLTAIRRRHARPGLRASLAAVCVLVLPACGSFDSASNRIASLVTPYKVAVVQGNFVSREQIEVLKPGMSRAQVKDILGSPLLASVFHANRWDYVFTINRQGVEPQSRKLAVYFKGDVLDHFEGDAMPSEAEFVSKLDTGRAIGKIPVLEASEDVLRKFPAAPAASQPQDDAASAPLPTSYPPLEPLSR